MFAVCKAATAAENGELRGNEKTNKKEWKKENVLRTAQAEPRRYRAGCAAPGGRSALHPIFSARCARPEAAPSPVQGKAGSARAAPPPFFPPVFTPPPPFFFFFSERCPPFPSPPPSPLPAASLPIVYLPNEGGGDGRAVSDSGSPGARPGRERRTAAEPLRGERSGCGVPRGTEITGLIAKSR